MQILTFKLISYKFNSSRVFYVKSDFSDPLGAFLQFLELGKAP